jgi:bifunctional non-homologous end joining protein LigD
LVEGPVAKRLGSKYKPGRTSPDWIKIKNFEHREVVIGGWITHRDGAHGILVGDRDGDKLAFAGVVDIGVGPKLIGVLETIRQEESPFAAAVELPRRARFVQPRLMAEVQYLAGSDALRHAAPAVRRITSRRASSQRSVVNLAGIQQIERYRARNCAYGVSA